MENELDEALAAPYVLAATRRAVSDGCDAIVIDCALDPALAAAREAVSVPVLGAGEAAFLLARSLGERAVLLAHAQCIVPAFRRRIRTYGLTDHVAAIRVLGTPILDMGLSEAVEEALRAACRTAINEDRADVIILGCTGLAPIADRVRCELSVPLVEPAGAALRLAEAMEHLGPARTNASEWRTSWIDVLDSIQGRDSALPSDGRRNGTD